MSTLAQAAQSIILIRTKTYALAIYQGGTNRLTARDGFVGVASGYYTPVQQYAAANYTQYQIDQAYANGWLTEQEYLETISYI